MSQIAQKIASNTASQLAAKVINAAISVVIVKLITSTLGTFGYGEYAFVYEFLSFFLIAADLGLFTIAVQEMAQEPRKLKETLRNVLAMRLVLVALLSGLAIGIANLVPTYSANIRLGINLAAISMSLNLLAVTVSSALQAHLKMTRAAVALVIGKIVSLGYIAYAAIKLPTETLFFHYITAGLAGNMVMLILMGAFTWPVASLGLTFHWPTWKRLLKRTIVYGSSLIFATFYLRLATIILQGSYGSEAVGIYNAPFRVYELMILVPIVLMNSVLPILTEELKQKSKRVRPLLQHSLDFLMLAGIGLVAGTFPLAKPIILALFHETFLGSIPVLQLMSVAALLVFMYTLFAYFLLAINQQAYLLKLNLAIALLSFPLYLFFIKVLATGGAVLALIVLQALALLFVVRKSNQHQIAPLSIANGLKAVFAGALTMTSLYILTPLLEAVIGIASLLVLIPFSFACYALLLFLFGAITDPVLRMILKQELPLIRPPQKIALDARVTIGNKAGKGWYVYQLLEALGEIDQRNQYYLYARHDFHLPPGLGKNFHKVILPLPLMIWHIGALVHMVVRGIDLLFAPSSYIIPSIAIFRKPRVILVIHDLVAFLFPRRHDFKATAVEKSTLQTATANADHIICVSENTKNDLRRIFKVMPEKISVIAEAARQNFKPSQGKKHDQKILRKYNLPNNYLLFVGTLEPRKNLVRLIEAYHLLAPELRKDLHLVMIGGKGWSFNEIFSKVKEYQLEERVHFPGYVPDADLPAILSNARIFIYPSLYEGFGLPILEGFACETPVICSDTPALQEVGHGACYRFPAENSQALADAITDLSQNPAKAKQLVAAGKERLKQYSWQKTAQAVLDVLES
ncbi:MAG: hypothetical protein A2788_00465 [Candidatus Abawacabacteria bacterium RIFCSPHIGHO2_01_FULL_46_8]|uniref:Glycosyl transferase family 1 domain-containing protein n=1 Tax=Candidatus Abawacabacteria bacterium RIFCSPHIGHO2_01_FULL_46_8 TaxID=1817815 RepID=A0A1F4XMP2_9BACT|nr:MAG: hypothetical protein A2788_00465 [Candidatus Abawacabacteria bacterium RIFCSPHIGHO2_01_FULL_46_8]